MYKLTILEWRKYIGVLKYDYKLIRAPKNSPIEVSIEVPIEVPIDPMDGLIFVCAFLRILHDCGIEIAIGASLFLTTHQRQRNACGQI